MYIYIKKKAIGFNVSCVLCVTSNITRVQNQETNVIRVYCKMFYVNVKLLVGDIWFLLYKYKEET